MERIDNIDNQEMEIALDNEAKAYQGMGIKLLAIVGGLLSSMFVLGWIFAFLSGFAIASIVTGVIILVAAVVVDEKAESTLVDTACIGAYIVACIMVGYGVNKLFGSDNLTTLVMLVIALAVPFFTSGYMLNFIAVLTFNGCLFALVNINSAYNLIHVLVAIFALAYTLFSLNEAKLLALGKKINLVYNPCRNALLCSLLALLGYVAVDDLLGKHIRYEWISSGAIVCIYLFFLNAIIGYLKIEERASRVLIYSGSLTIMLMAVFSPATCGALLILLISFHTGHRLGLILGVVGVIYFVGQFYYNLHYTLLIKSMIMFGTGTMFLAAWLILKKTLKRYEQG